MTQATAVETDSAIVKARAALTKAQGQLISAQAKAEAALLDELDGTAGSATAKNTAQRAIEAAEADVRTAERAVQAAVKRASQRAAEAQDAELRAAWKKAAQVAKKREEVGAKLSGALAEVAALYRELCALDRDLAAAPVDVPGSKGKLGEDQLLIALKLEAVRHGLPLMAWPWGQVAAPSLASQLAESAGAVLVHRVA